jgi:hypothetical protein
MVDPFVAGAPDVDLGPERPVVRFALGALVDQRALRARERRRLLVALDEVLAQFRPDVLEQEAQVADHRIVAQDGVARLAPVVQAERRQRAEGRRHGEPTAAGRGRCRQRGGAQAGGEARRAQREDRVADREGSE